MLRVNLCIWQRSETTTISDSLQQCVAIIYLKLLPPALGGNCANEADYLCLKETGVRTSGPGRQLQQTNLAPASLADDALRLLAARRR